MKKPRVLVHRDLPTPPAVRGSASLYLAEAAGQGVQGDRTMLFVGAEPAPEHIADALGVSPDGDVIARRKLLLADGVPVRIATSFFRADLFAGTRIAEDGFVKPSLQSAIVDRGYRFGHAEETLIARPAAEFERVTLQLDPDEWVVRILRTSYDTDDTPVHALETICSATRHVFTIAQPAGLDTF